MIITKYRVILTNGSAEYGSEQAAMDYNALVGGLGVELVEYDIPDKTAQDLINEAQALITAMRAERDRLMAETVAWQARLDRQVRQSLPLTFTQLQLDTYTKALADLPSVYPTGVDVVYPVKPV